MMKAAIRSAYGAPELISIEEVDKPSIKANEILIQVYAATVNRSDCGILRGKPFIIRLFTGLFGPRHQVTGSDFAGRVVATGGEVRSFQVGDRVMGFGGIAGCGSHAEFLAFPETGAVLHMPDALSYEAAAASMEGAFYAASGVAKLQPKAGQKALVNGATGAIGSAMVQFLKYHDVYVTAVCGGENLALVSSLGADRVIDYKREDFTLDHEQYDFVFDSVGKSSFAKCKRLLKEKGIYAPSEGFINFWLAIRTSLSGGKRVAFAPPGNLKKGLEFIRRLIIEGRFAPLIDRRYPLEKITEAFKYVESGEKIGNVIVSPVREK